MKIYGKEGFQPVDIVIRCETQDELDRLGALFNNAALHRKKSGCDKVVCIS